MIRASRDPATSRLLIADLAAPRPEGPSLSDWARLAGCSRTMASACARGERKPNGRMRMAAELLWNRPWQELFAPADSHVADQSGSTDE